MNTSTNKMDAGKVGVFCSMPPSRRTVRCGGTRLMKTRKGRLLRAAAARVGAKAAQSQRPGRDLAAPAAVEAASLCLLPGCYRCCPCLDVDTSQGAGRCCFNCRKCCLNIVQSKFFKFFINFIVVLSSMFLVKNTKAKNSSS